MRRNWTREELIVAFNLYCKLPFGQLHARNPRIVELGQALARTPGAVAMKLVNFAALDPTHQKRGVAGLGNTGKGDRAVWEEFHGHWADLAVESEKALLALRVRPGEPLPEDEEDGRAGRGATERERLLTVRLGQAFFREAVLASYGSRCCVCGLPVAALLVASHIVPWAARADVRVNPRNGLCLCALHDRAFDRGLLTVDEGLAVRLSGRLGEHLGDGVVRGMFVAYRGRGIRAPEKFGPGEEFLAYHREKVFVAG